MHKLQKTVLKNRVADPERFDADADPDPTFILMKIRDSVSG